MNRDYLELWKQQLHSRVSQPLRSKITVTVERNKHLGPTWQFAKIQLSVTPALTFEVVDKASPSEELKAFGYPDWAIFGLLDVLMVTDSFPIDKIRIVLEKADFHPVDSSPMAFREAGRNAGRKIIEAWKGSDS